MSMSVSNSQSTSTPVVTQTPQNAILDQIAGYASNLAGQMYNWAQSTFAQTSAVTSQAVSNFFNVSQQMTGLSNNLTDQYNNLFAPENAQLVADANSYASPARMQADMGMAGATQAQAGQDALAKSEQDLASYGIDPSSGRYAALDKAAAVQNAANVAGAENVQRQADITTGQNLRAQAVQVGAQLPAAIANVNNTAIQANTGAANATDANANTGANLMKLPNDYLGTAMGLKLPLQGQQSQSTSTGTSSSPAKPPSGGSGGGGGGAPSGSPFGPSTPAWGMNMPTGNGNGGSSASASRGQPNAGVMGGINLGNQPGAQGYDLSGLDTGMGSVGAPTTDPFASYGSGTDTGAGAFGNNFGQDFGTGNTFSDPSQSFSGDPFSGGSTSMGNGSDMTGLGSYDYGNNQASLPSGWQDPATQTTTDPGVWGNGASSTDLSGAGSDPFSNAGGVDLSGGSFDPSQMTDLSGGSYAAGGPIPATQSPSGGRQVDDIKAQGPGGQPLRMNANEFVIPQDVALWKGQEFFQNLIDQSRKRRVTASAQPSPMPAGK